MRDALRHSTRVAGGSSSFSLPHFIGEPPHNADGDADGNRIPPQHAASLQTPLKSGFLHRIPPHHAQRIGLRTEKVAGSSPAELALKSPANAQKQMVLVELSGVIGSSRYKNSSLSTV